MSGAVYQHRENPVHRLNPLTKLAFTAALSVAAFAVPITWWPAALFVVILLPAVIAAGVQRRFGRLVIKLVGPLVIAVFVVQGLFFPEGDAVLAQLGPISIKTDGLLFAVRTATRLLVLVGAFLFLLLTTHPGVLMTAMVQRGMAPKISYVVSATLQILPVFQTRAQNILQAQRARGMEIGGSLFDRMRALLPLVGPLVLGSLTEVEERGIAMEARAFGASAQRTSLVVVPDSAAQRFARWGLWILALAIVVANAAGVFR